MSNSFVRIQSFSDYIEANIILGKLESENIQCYLMDENTVTTMPLWNQAVGGIKLMVAASQAERALALLREYAQERKQKIACLQCGSFNVEYVSSPKNPGNLLGAFLGFFLGDLAVSTNKVYRCFDCGNEFKPSHLSED